MPYPSTILYPSSSLYLSDGDAPRINLPTPLLLQQHTTLLTIGTNMTQMGIDGNALVMSLDGD